MGVVVWLLGWLPHPLLMKKGTNEIFEQGDLVRMKNGSFYLDQSFLIESDPGIGIVISTEGEKIEVFFSLFGSIALDNRLIEKIVCDE